MENKLKSRLKKLLSTILLILGFWTIASTVAVAFPPDLREQVKVLTVQGAIELLAEKLDDLAGRVSKLELEAARNKACDRRDELAEYPDFGSEEWPVKPATRVSGNMRWLGEVLESGGDESWYDFNSNGATTDQEKIAEARQRLLTRYQGYLTAKSECERLTNEYQERYGE